MSASPFLLFANSQPTSVSDDVWTQYHLEEYIPDLINTGTVTRAVFYQEVATVFGGEPTHPRKFLTLCPTIHPDPLRTPEYQNIRRFSEILTSASGKGKVGENGDVDVRNYELVQDFNPDGRDKDIPAPYLLLVEMQPPPQNVEDFDRYYREEHLPMLSRAPGYRRCLRYRLGARTHLTKGDPPEFLALHKVDDLSLFESAEANASYATEWTQKHIAQSTDIRARGWKLIRDEEEG